MAFAKLLLVVALYALATLLFSRLLLWIFPWRRDHPAQGTFTLAALLALGLALASAYGLSEGPLADRLGWLAYLAVLLGSAALVMISVLCVSESGRRFYLLHLIDSGVGSLTELRARYGHEHMMEARLERLLKWRVLRESVGRLQMVKWTAYAYSRFFHLWGRLLGFHWR